MITIIKPKAIPRKEWEMAFQEMRESGDGRAFMTDVIEDKSVEEWS